MEESISTRLEKLERQQLEASIPTTKKFKLPISSAFQTGKVKKKGFAHVIKIGNGGDMQIKTLPIEDNTVKFGEYFYDARSHKVLRWKGLPTLIIPEWNIDPLAPPENHLFDPKKNYEEAAKSGKLTMPQKVILTKMKMEAIKQFIKQVT